MDGLRIPVLHDLTLVKHDGTVRDVPHDRQVVGDEQQRQAHALLQFAEQVQHLRLHREIERADRLIADDKAWAGNDRARNRDALALAAGKLRGIARGGIRRHPDAGQNVADAGVTLSARQRAVHQQGLCQRVADRARRIERAVWVLKHHLDFARQIASPAPRRMRDVLAVETDTPRRGRSQTKDDAADRRFAGTGLADQPDRFAGHHVKGHAIEGAKNPRAALREMNVQVRNAEKRPAHPTPTSIDRSVSSIVGSGSPGFAPCGLAFSNAAV